MLPEVVEAKKALRCIVSTSILLVLFSLLLYLLGSFGLLYLIIASVLGVPLLLLNLWPIIHPMANYTSVEKECMGSVKVFKHVFSNSLLRDDC